jgi:hypothetical protein
MSRDTAHQGNPQHHPLSITNLRLIHHNNVEAVADVDTGCGMIISGFALLDEPGQAMRIVVPVTQRIDRAGKKLYTQLVKVDPAVKSLIDQALFDAYRSAMLAGEGVGDA